uniref:Uncharacterized protein n=1 Tax=Triatoma infestans TaxID=30076 RepID=A0A023F1Z8_TRIIF
MRLEEQSEKFPICNQLMLLKDDEPVKLNRHGLLLPDSIRALICGTSGSGKTNLMVCLLLQSNGLKFTNVYICSRSIQQDKYIYLENIFKLVPEIGYFTIDNAQQIPNNAEPNSIIIFDDISMDEQENIRKYFSMGRHKQIDCFYLCQSYAKIPKHLVRDNANFIILFEQDELNLRHVYSDHISSPNISFDKFKQMCNICWQNRHGFLTIDKTRDMHNGRFRKDLDTFIYI